MKNRLLEDFGDSQSALPVRAPGQASASARAAGPPARQRPGVWRSRAPAPPPRPRATPAPEPFTPSATAAPPDIASFSSTQPDWSVPVQAQPPSWSERWGRKALGWTLGVAAVVAAGATAAWMVRETEVQSTLAVVAGQTPARASVDAPPVVTAAPLPEPEAEALPPLKLLPREQLATAAPDSGPAATERVGDAAGTGDAAQAETGNAQTLAAQPPAALPVTKPATKPAEKAAEKAAVKRAPERRVAAAQADKRRQPEARKPAPKQARDTAPSARAAPAAAPDPQSPLAETLRLCRAAGYHATACLKRGCEATRFGLVCRG